MSQSESRFIHNCCFSATDTEKMSLRPRVMQVEEKGAGTGVRDLSNWLMKMYDFFLICFKQ